jgi:hypothetical protein
MSGGFDLTDFIVEKLNTGETVVAPPSIPAPTPAPAPVIAPSAPAPTVNAKVKKVKKAKKAKAAKAIPGKPAPAVKKPVLPKKV